MGEDTPLAASQPWATVVGSNRLRAGLLGVEKECETWGFDLGAALVTIPWGDSVSCKALECELRHQSRVLSEATSKLGIP